MSDIRRRTEELLSEHASTYVDRDGDTRCECGKWLEPGEHEWPKHVAWLLDDAHLLADAPVELTVSDTDRNGVEFGRNCQTLGICRGQNACIGTCKLF